MSLSYPYLRTVLRVLWSNKPSTTTLTAHLLAQLTAKFETVGKGKVLVSASGKGVSSTYEIHGYSVEDVVEGLNFLCELYDLARQTLVDAGNASPTDEQIHAEMMGRLQATAFTTNDYSGMIL